MFQVITSHESTLSGIDYHPARLGHCGHGNKSVFRFKIPSLNDWSMGVFRFPTTLVCPLACHSHDGVCLGIFSIQVRIGLSIVPLSLVEEAKAFATFGSHGGGTENRLLVSVGSVLGGSNWVGGIVTN